MSATMKITQNATIEHLQTLTAEQLRNFWYDAHYHPSRYATGKGSKRYVRALANFASNLSTFKFCGEEMYNQISNTCADNARKLLMRYGGVK